MLKFVPVDLSDPKNWDPVPIPFPVVPEPK